VNQLRVKQAGQVDYAITLARQKEFTDQRGPDSVDEIWCLEHNPVYTLGLSGKTEHILEQNTIPVFETDRGGQVTYHGPGQLVVYLLLDLKRKAIPVRKYVYSLEQAIINMLDGLRISAHRKVGAPGVYVEGKKIAALGIRIRRGCCYHGVSLNVDMDLSPFEGINPCGYPKLAVTQLLDLGYTLKVADAGIKLVSYLASELGYEKYSMHEQRQPRELRNL
jgi:lipoyl(octanoyl) transferase